MKRTDITVVRVPGNEIAEKLGNHRLANMVVLGGLLANLEIVPIDALKKALREHLPARHQKLLPANMQAIDEGAACEVIPAK